MFNKVKGCKKTDDETKRVQINVVQLSKISNQNEHKNIQFVNRGNLLTHLTQLTVFLTVVPIAE